MTAPAIRPARVRPLHARSLLAAAFGALLAAPAAAQQPEVERAVGTPQAVGAAHTLRTLHEACARLEGMFTGQPGRPYAFTATRTHANCQPRAKLVDALEARPSIEAGWKLNDVIRVPNAACPSQMAVVQVWRKPSASGPPELDAQGRARIYLAESMADARAGKLASLPQFAAAMTLEGEGCGN
jgi:hypothetical protein